MVDSSGTLSFWKDLLSFLAILLSFLANLFEFLATLLEFLIFLYLFSPEPLILLTFPTFPWEKDEFLIPKGEKSSGRLSFQIFQKSVH